MRRDDEMKKMAGTFRVAACLLLASVSAASAGVAERKRSPEAGQLNFGLDLLSRTVPAQSNGMVSPASAVAVLAMLAQGGDGWTQKAITQMLRLSSLEELTRLGRSMGGFADQVDDPAVTIGMANGLWLDTSTTLKSGFTRAVREDLAADVRRTDLATPAGVAQVDDWVSQKTNGQIPQLLGSPPPNPSMVALNAFHFDGKWTLPFDQAQTQTQPFTRSNGRSVPVPMMQLADAQLAYREEAGARAVDLTYGNGRFHWTVVMPPAAGKDPVAWAQGARRTAVPMLQGQGFSPRLVALNMPRLRMQATAQLLDAMKALGLRKALQSPGSFAGIASPSPVLGQVMQKSVIEVNEQGTRAAAATAALMERSAVAANKVQMRVNRPFLFALRDEKLGAILMVGVVRNPS